MAYDFDSIIERRRTKSMKWDALEELFGQKDLIPLWVADMDFKSPPEVIEAVINRAEHGIFGYAGSYDSYFTAVVNWLKRRFQWEVEKEWIVPCPGVIPALNLLVRTFTNPGDKVIIQPPVYHPFYKAIRNNGCHVLQNPLKLEGGRYHMDFNDLEKKIDDRTRMLILCSPHNPVGRVWRREELVELAEICLKYDILVVSDEIHADLVYKNFRHVPFPIISREISTNCIVLTAPSKTFNLAGLQTSNTIIPDALLRKIFKAALESIGFSRPNIFGLEALEAAYTYGEPWLEALLSYLEGNLEFLTNYIEEKIPPLKVIRPEGTYLVWLDCRELGMTAAELENFMRTKVGLALNEGYIFGSGGEGFERINIACPRSLLKTALQKLEKAVREL